MKKMGYKILYALRIAMPVTTSRLLFALFNQTKIKASFQVLSYDYSLIHVSLLLLSSGPPDEIYNLLLQISTHCGSPTMSFE